MLAWLFPFQYQRILKARTQGFKLQLSIPEIKLLIVFFFYAAIGMLILLLFELTSDNYFHPTLEEAFLQYFTCEAGGNVPGKCSREYQIIQNQNFSYLVAIILLLPACVPLVNLMFVINWRYLQEKLQMCKKSVAVYQTLEGNDNETQPTRTHA